MASSNPRVAEGSRSGPPSPPHEAPQEDYEHGHGHYFSKKTFHKPTFCHHCTDMLWGLIGQGYICEICNFVVHERCLKTVITPCSTLAGSAIKNPVPHCWGEPGHLKRKFCNACRRRIEESTAIRCEVCEYSVHLECHDFSVADCIECATFNPQRELETVIQNHHWREGNLPSNSKCCVCRKACWSAECLSGMRCEWCGTTAHPLCHKTINQECNFGMMSSILLPPACVSIPRTDVPLEAIIGVVQSKKKENISLKCSSSARSLSEEFSSLEFRESDESSAYKEKDRDEELIRVYDGNNSLKRKAYRTIVVPRISTRRQIIKVILRAIHIFDDPANYYMTDIYDSSEKELPEYLPVLNLTKHEGKRASVMLRYRPPDPDSGSVKVYPGNIGDINHQLVINVTTDTAVEDLIQIALEKFGLSTENFSQYHLSEVTLDKGSVHERMMDNQECPWELLKNMARESVRQREKTRFYLRRKENVHNVSVALFVGNLPPNLSQRQYEMILINLLAKPYKFRHIGPIYYEYGSLIITYDNADIAVKAFYMLRESTYEDKTLLVLLLPKVMADMVPQQVRPLLVFVNVKSGGCQGLELISSFRRLLNPYQVYDLDNGGPLPGLYVFRNIKYYKILVCGGDGTVGWVLQCLDNVGQDSVCQSPPCAILPLGTGNDLARVLRWGAGYAGGEDPQNLLRDVIEAEDIILDRWTVVFHSDERPEGGGTPTTSSTTSEDNAAIFVMNNYFGIGLDAELCLDFHNAREEHPDRFNSRLHNKGVYVIKGLRKMVARKTYKDLQKAIRLEVDGKVIDLPSVEGIIILNILSWGSGANPWGPEKDDSFSKPTHYDGMLEVVGISGVVHMGQIQSGLRSGVRIAQGGHIKIRFNTYMPVQVDGEPWVQGSGEAVVLKSALKATMLKKSKNKFKRRNTEPSMGFSGTSDTSPQAPSASAHTIGAF